VLQILYKVSVDEVFMHYYEKMLSASGGPIPSPGLSAPGPPWRLPSFRPLTAHPWTNYVGVDAWGGYFLPFLSLFSFLSFSLPPASFRFSTLSPFSAAKPVDLTDVWKALADAVADALWGRLRVWGLHMLSCICWTESEKLLLFRLIDYSRS